MSREANGEPFCYGSRLTVRQLLELRRNGYEVIAANNGLEGLRVVVDCGHGAMFEAAPEVIRRLGADVIVINAEPSGRNINDHCGATHPAIPHMARP